MEVEERSQESIISRIKKLLSKSVENGCTEEESAAALATASRMLAEHNLDMDSQAMNFAPPEAWVDEPFFETHRWELDDNLIYEILRAHFFVEMHAEKRGRVKTMYLFGKRENVEVAKFIRASLHAAFDQYWMMHKIIHRVVGRGERRLFITGMTEGYMSKLADERRALEAERDIGTPGTGLAIINIEAQIQAMCEANGRLGSGTSRFAPTTGSQSTFDAGRAAGLSLNFSRELRGPERQKGINQ